MDEIGLTHVLSPQGWALLQALPPYDEALVPSLSERLRKEGNDPAVIAAALTQSRLRAKAVVKFGEFAAGMLFTPAGLEQATRLLVAAQHADRFRTAGCRRVIDITCGIGADAMVLAGVGLDVIAVELDEATASVATVNLRYFPEVEVRHGDGLAQDLDGVDGLWADPARRTSSGARRHDPSAYAPSLDAVLALRDRVTGMGIKVGPGMPHAAIPADAEAQWVSVGGDVVELTLWLGATAPHGPGRSALLITADGNHLVSSDPTAAEPPPVGPVGAYLYEPDGAVIRAGLVSTVAAEVRGRLIDPTIAYVTSDSFVPTAAATAYRVVDQLSFSLKSLRAYLRAREVGALTIKKRGTAVVPEDLRRRLELRGGATATIVLTRVAGKQSVLVVEPLAAPPSAERPEGRQ